MRESGGIAGSGFTDFFHVIYSRRQWAKRPCLHGQLANAARVKYPAALQRCKIDTPSSLTISSVSNVMDAKLVRNLVKCQRFQKGSSWNMLLSGLFWRLFFSTTTLVPHGICSCRDSFDACSFQQLLLFLMEYAPVGTTLMDPLSTEGMLIRYNF